MSIRISDGGRLFEIMAGLGGATMLGSAGLPWAEAVFVSSGQGSYNVNGLNGGDRLALLVLGLFVIAGAACFIALGSRRMRMMAGALVVLAAAAGLVIALLAEPPSLAGLGSPCPDAPCLQVSEGSGRVLAGFGASLAAGCGIVALLRSGGQADRTTAAGRSPAVPSVANPPDDFATPRTRRMSDASLLALTMVAIAIAVVVGFVVVVQQVCSEAGEWC